MAQAIFTHLDILPLLFGYPVVKSCATGLILRAKMVSKFVSIAPLVIIILMNRAIQRFFESVYINNALAYMKLLPNCSLLIPYRYSMLSA